MLFIGLKGNKLTDTSCVKLVCSIVSSLVCSNMIPQCTLLVPDCYLKRLGRYCSVCIFCPNDPISWKEKSTLNNRFAELDRCWLCDYWTCIFSCDSGEQPENFHPKLRIHDLNHRETKLWAICLASTQEKLSFTAAISKSVPDQLGSLIHQSRFNCWCEQTHLSNCYYVWSRCFGFFLTFPIALFMKVSNELFFSFVVKVISDPYNCGKR